MKKEPIPSSDRLTYWIIGIFAIVTITVVIYFYYQNMIQLEEEFKCGANLMHPDCKPNEGYDKWQEICSKITTLKECEKRPHCAPMKQMGYTKVNTEKSCCQEVPDDFANQMIQQMQWTGEPNIPDCQSDPTDKTENGVAFDEKRCKKKGAPFRAFFCNWICEDHLPPSESQNIMNQKPPATPTKQP